MIFLTLPKPLLKYRLRKDDQINHRWILNAIFVNTICALNYHIAACLHKNPFPFHEEAYFLPSLI